MAEITKMKEVNAEFRKIYELIELHASEQRTLATRLAEENKLRMDAFQQTWESFMQNQQSTSNQSHGSSSNAEHPSFPGSPQVRKFNFDFPRFDGTNALEWIFNVDKFFDYYHIPDLERVSIASMHVDKGVVPWFQMMQRNLPFRSWHDLKRAIEMEFGPSMFDCPRASLFKLTQTGFVGDYYSECTALANRVHGTT